jgi:conjugal transfer/entry exclusion protein
MWCSIATAAAFALLAVALVPAVRKHFRDEAAATGKALAELTDEQRAEYERLTADRRRRQAEEAAERARAEALMREMDEREGR